jgi:hypothetical protein
MLGYPSLTYFATMTELPLEVGADLAMVMWPFSLAFSCIL